MSRGGWRGGGRPKGSRNKRSVEIERMLEEMGCNPILAMAQIAMDGANPIEIRAMMYRELAGYVAPKLKSIDVNANVKNELVVVRRVFSDENQQKVLEGELANRMLSKPLENEVLNDDDEDENSDD